jgi:hypothetical protein
MVAGTVYISTEFLQGPSISRYISVHGYPTISYISRYISVLDTVGPISISVYCIYEYKGTVGPFY